MVSFGAPLYLIIAGAVAALVVALHLLNPLVRRNESFPTARFIPDAPASFYVRPRQISDAIPLLLRVAILLLIGAALAQPRLHHPTRTTARIAVSAQGSLSSSIVTALREASRLRDSADSLELVISAPFVRSQDDAATSTIRALWPGGIQIVRVPSASAQRTSIPAHIEWADSAPQTAAWWRRERADTVGAVRVNERVLIAPFVREWALDTSRAASARVVARWIDGAPAAVEISRDSVCTRSIAFDFPTQGDYMLRPGFSQALSDLSAPTCISEPASARLSADELAGFARGTPRVASTSIVPSDRGDVTLRVVLLALAFAISLLDLLVRRRSSQVQE